MDEEDQSRCMKLAKPLLPDMYEGWQEALARYLRTAPEIIAEHDDTTAANCIRAHMWAEVVRRFGGRRGCKLLRLNGLNLLNYRNETLWRFKQVDGVGRHRNYQTVQQRRYDAQLSLPGLPPEAVRLTSGYQPDTALQSILRVVVARPFGKSMRWTSQVNVVDGAAGWVDITPARFAGTTHFETRSAR